MGSARVGAQRPPRRRAVAACLLGVFLVQAAWILVVPPFRGLDETDHAYKAAAVARGDWRATHVASPQGWGAFVEVPSDLVTASRPICEPKPWTHSDNCVGTGTDASGMTTVASSASGYNPVFYFVIGTAALPFSGTDALYAMRIAASLMCAALITMAVAVSFRWARSSWPRVAILLAATPTFMYSTVVAAPNGVEAAAGLAVWSALLGLVHTRDSPALQRPFVVAATVAAVPLVVVRGLGPLWLLLIVLTVAPMLGWSRLGRLLRRRDTVVGAAIVLAATAGAAVWTLSAGVTDMTEGKTLFPGSPWPGMLGQWVLWFFQAYAAVPGRSEPPHLSVYMIGLAAWWIFVAVAWLNARWRERGVLLLILAFATIVPIAATVATYATIEYGWQGRYTYPYAVGFLLICGYVLDRTTSTTSSAPARWPVWIAAAVLLATGLIGQLRVLRVQLRDSPLTDTGAWLQPSEAVIVALNVVGVLLLAWALSPGADKAIAAADRQPAIRVT